MPKTRIFLAISILILTTLACNALFPTAEPTPIVILEPGNPSTPSNLPLTEADVPRASLEEAYTAYVAGAAIIVDVRSKEAFAERHVVGALSIPLDEFEINIGGVNLDKEQWIITYCT
ncbi:MAG TPA: rhodanese-like domain-containing protein [Anaerolineales bacterium]|nr:rhodanese-like domain-containing protein [Anaerolineales bacterium]HNQ94098.1 rhodanese-like domain-containing protein [Anaerolineales bacterium]HNS61857.1 rhodanese-like domain-containing protein [Anaerolineales bacterium]